MTQGMCLGRGRLVQPIQPQVCGASVPPASQGLRVISSVLMKEVVFLIFAKSP